MDTIGNRVRFTNDGLMQYGTVEDAVSYLENWNNRDFLNLIQYIRWDNGKHTIRMCYYVRPSGSSDKDWVFANRPLAMNAIELGRLLNKAKGKTWFPT
jgi:hypothetical protein